MSLKTGLLVVIALVCGVARTPLAAPGPTEKVDGGGFVTKVDASKKKPTATLDKGTKAGLKVGDTCQIYPLRTSEGSTSTSVNFDVRLAVGKVIDVKDTSATVALESIVDTIEIGSYFSYDIIAPASLTQSPLFRVTALGIELRPQSEVVPFITVEQLLADPSDARINKALDAMIADIKGMKDVITGALKDPIQEGEYHGKTAGQIVDALDRAQITDFLVFVEGFPGKYIGHHWKTPEIYFTWIISGTPSGERNRQVRKASASLTAASQAVLAGKLDEARAHYQTVLKTVPDHKDALENSKKIDQILLLTRTVAADPDDTANGYTLANELFNIGAYELAMTKLAPLKKRGYDPFKTERLRAYLLVRQKKFKDAEVVFKKLQKDRKDDKNLAEWLAYSRAQAKIAKNPKDAVGHMELAEVHIMNKSWDSTLSEYRKVLDSPNATAKQREIAKAAQERISIQKDVDDRLEWARGDIKEHDLKGARDRIAQAVKLLATMKDDKQAGEMLEELAGLARASSEDELALELYGKRVESVPTSMAAHAALAYALLGVDRLDEAEAAAKKSLEQKGDPAYSHLILSYVARSRGDLAAMETHATKATENSPKYAWPLLVLARAEAVRGDWQAALVHAKKALDLDNEQHDMRSTHLAVHRGIVAAEGLQAAPTSARDRLRLVRALADLGLVAQATAEIAKLPNDGTWRSDAWWSIVVSPDSRVMLKDRLTAARNSKPTLEIRKRQLALLEARAALRANPKDDATRIALARLYILSEESYDLALATLGPLMTQTPLKPGVGDLMRDARQAIEVTETQALADAAAKRRDFTGAIQLALTAQKIHDRIGTPYGRLIARSTGSGALSELGRYPEAIALIEENLKISKELGDITNVAISEQQLGGLKSNIGTNDAHRKALEDSHKLCTDSDNELSCYYTLVQLVNVEKDEGRNASALEYARKAWQLAEKLGRFELARNARFELANAYLNVNRYTDGEQVALKLLTDSRKANDINNEQLSLMVLGYVHMMRAQGKQARARFQEVYDLGTRTGDTNYRALALRFQGTAWLSADHEPAKAATLLQQADDLYKSLGEGWAVSARGSILRELADAYVQAGKLPEARKAAEQALVLAERFQRRPALASSHWTLALVAIKEKKPDEALTRSQVALASAQKTDDDAMLWNAWHALAKANELKGNDAAAVDAYEKALEFLGRALQSAGGEDERKAYMNTGRVREVYTDAVERFLKAGKTQRAMEILELSRDALLKQQFDPTKVGTKDAKLRARLDKYEEARSRVLGLQKQLDKAMEKPAAQRSDAQVKALGERIAKTRQELNQVVLDLKVTHRHLFQALAMDPQNLVGRKDELPPGSVLVEYFVADDALYAFIIAANLSQPAVVRVKVGSAELEKTIEEWREALIAENERVKQRDRVVELGRQLDDWLLEPLRPHLDGATSVILLPFGSLYYVPFDALVVSEAGQPTRYAIEDFRISIQTATTLEHLLKKPRARSTGTMLAISNPDGSLPGAQAEVSRIVKSVLPDARVLLRNQATVQKFRDMAGNYRYLHLATHGILDADPRKSYMKMFDGELTVKMISQLQGLDTANELVVLSACDTAVEAGKSTGDELVSVAVAFSMAGSPSLVASLWEVGDDSTAELMATFYKALESTTGDRLDALRNAKLTLLRMQRGTRKPFAEPWHWSSFQMYGDYRMPK